MVDQRSLLAFAALVGALVGALAASSLCRSAAPMRISKKASYAQVAAAFSRFLQTDDRVPSETRRLALGLAPHGRRTERHYGNVEGVLPGLAEGAPYDARDALRSASDPAAWPSPLDQMRARAAVNYSLFLWNQIFGHQP